MAPSRLEDRIARLQREIERLSAEHAERMAKRGPSASAKIRELDVKRAEMLAQRIRRLEETLQELRHQSEN